MNILSKPRHYSLAEAADGTLSIDKQGTEVVTALMNSLFGVFNGGRTGSTGWTHTVVNTGVAAAGATGQLYLSTGKLDIPFINR